MAYHNKQQHEEPAASADLQQDKNSTPSNSFFGKLTEDWWAVGIGGILIVLVLLSTIIFTEIKLTAPVYQWANTNDLFFKVLSVNNMLLIAAVGLVFVSLSSFAVI